MTTTDQSSPLRQCFICLLDSTETPENEDWVNPCPCTLEAHQSCMLRWVAEMEAAGGGSRNRGRRASTLQCPACKGNIQVFEPFDPALWLRDRMLQTYSAVSPVLLMCFVGGSTFGAMVKFGDFSVATFAGSFSAVRKWRLDGIQRPLDPRWFATSAGLKFATIHMFKLWALASIGPALIISKAFSGIGNLLLPVSLASSVLMTAKDNVPHWPPSPEWALTAMPAVSLCYSHVYYTLFGRFEKRLNAAIRGRDPDAPQEEAQLEQQHNGQDQQGPQQPGQRRRNNRDRGVNVWEAGLGRIMALAIALVFGLDDEEGEQDGEGRDGDDQRVEFELEINLQVPDDEAQEAPQDQMAIAQAPAPDELEPVPDVGTIPLPAEVEPGQEPEVQVENADLQPETPGANQAAAEEAADPPPAIQPAPQPQAQPDQPAEQPRQRRVEGAGISTWSRIINGTVSALLMPQISFAMGEVLRLTLPARWVSKRWGAPKGLLQHTWGRSLVGTCLFVVLRDAVSLFVKYRRVQAIKNRTVRNFDPTAAVKAGSTA